MSIDSLYNKKVTDYFLHPRNMGAIKNPSGVGRVGNPVCGDVMELYIKISPKNSEDVISDAKFKTFGCGAAIASSSIMTEMIKGKTVKEALKTGNLAVAEALGGLPPVKRHCSVLAHEALEKAIADWKTKKKRVK
ncbi:MAG: iron-sulfur cluster assembly scaffold protein [Patescibacteria group bacterium]|jgi:nitrogen fixation NifU-like protein